MKNFLITLFLGSILILSCGKSHVDVIDSELSVAAKKAILAPTLEKLKQSVILLSDIDRKVLWGIKLKTILAKDQLTKDQRIIVNKIKLFLDNTNFEKLRNDIKTSDEFLANNLSYFQKHFNPYQIYMLIECPYFCRDFSIFKSQDYLESLEIKNHFPSEEGAPAEPNCTCYYSVYCLTTPHETGTSCITGSCAKAEGCGMFGGANCTGKCK